METEENAIESAGVPVRSVKKALDILNLLLFDDLAQEGRALGQLADAMGIKANTCHNLLKTLVACEYVERTADGLYAAGPQCRRIGFLNSLLRGIAGAEVDSLMAALNAELNEGVVFTVLLDGMRLTACLLHCQQQVTVNRACIQGGCPYEFPTGRVMVAYAPEKEVNRVLERHGFPKRRWSNINSREELADACARVREEISANGIYRMHEEIEKESDAAAYAVPCIGQDKKLVGAVGCFAPAYRVSGDALRRVQEKLAQTAARITELESVAFPA